jgi:hypothetical protein
VNGKTGKIYISDETSKDVEIWDRAEPPAVVTGAASSVTQTTASVAGTVNPNGRQVTDCHVDYGTTVAYGLKAPCSPAAPGSGTSAVAVSAALTGLTAGAEYHYRVVATSAVRASYGADATFKTKSVPVEQPAEKPADKPAEQPVDHSAAKPVEQPAAQAVQTPAGTKPVTRGQPLALAIKKCKKLTKHKQAACMRKAKKKYAPPSRHRAKRRK